MHRKSLENCSACAADATLSHELSAATTANDVATTMLLVRRNATNCWTRCGTMIVLVAVWGSYCSSNVAAAGLSGNSLENEHVWRMHVWATLAQFDGDWGEFRLRYIWNVAKAEKLTTKVYIRKVFETNTFFRKYIIFFFFCRLDLTDWAWLRANCLIVCA